LRTSRHLLDNRTPFQLEFTENIADVPLTLSKNVLELWLLATFGEVFHGLPRRLFLTYIFLTGNVVQLRSFLSREVYGTLVSLTSSWCSVTPGDVASERGGSPADLARHLDTGPGALSRVPLSLATHPGQVVPSLGSSLPDVSPSPLTPKRGGFAPHKAVISPGRSQRTPVTLWAYAFRYSAPAQLVLTGLPLRAFFGLDCCRLRFGQAPGLVKYPGGPVTRRLLPLPAEVERTSRPLSRTAA